MARAKKNNIAPEANIVCLTANILVIVSVKYMIPSVKPPNINKSTGTAIIIMAVGCDSIGPNGVIEKITITPTRTSEKIITTLGK
jgi:hypothetical protein